MRGWKGCGFVVVAFCASLSIRFGNKGPLDHLLCATFVCDCDAPVRVDGIDRCEGLEDGFDGVKGGFDDVLSCGFDGMVVDCGMDNCRATMEGDDVDDVGFLAVVGCLIGCDMVPNDCDIPSVGGLNGPQFWLDGSEDLGDFDTEPSSVAKRDRLLL